MTSVLRRKFVLTSASHSAFMARSYVENEDAVRDVEGRRNSVQTCDARRW